MKTPHKTPRPSRLMKAITRAVMPLALGLAAGLAFAGPPRDRITLLVPDDYATGSTWQVKVWQDAAADEGIRLELITDSQLIALGGGAAGRIAGLVVPDSAHIRASADVVAAIKNYAYTGGQLMLVYDAGVQDERGFYPLAGNSRFADLVGVDYVFWNNGAGAATMVGFGPVVGTKARLEALSFPPGKYQPYVPPASITSGTATTAFVPASASDPGGSQQVQPLMQERAKKGIEDGGARVRAMRPYVLRDLLGLGQENTSRLRFGLRNYSATPAINGHVYDTFAIKNGKVAAAINADTVTYREITQTEAAASANTLQQITGYGYGPISYYHYVTQGSFPGTVQLSSPEHGLVAGTRGYGSGQVTFVNMPLGYFKAIGTDSAPLHGFLNQFARDQVKVATMSVQPNGKGGLIYNWHIDDGDDLNTDVKFLLDSTGVLHRGPFSIHLTAGPDVINFGDGNGMNLPGNGTSQNNLQRLANAGWYGSWWNWNKLPDHAIGSHGGWIHDYWGAYANEQNSPDLTYLLQKNFDAIEAVTGRKIREYSSPVGNTPLWAINWLEARGVVAMYLVGDLGAGMVRSYRNGQRVSSKLWTSPVTPLGKYATWEEFDQFGIGNAQSGQWLLDLQSFVINKRTNRMFYNHPPGAKGHLGPVAALLNRADNQKAYGRFQWYTMTELADFSQRRVETTWNTSPHVWWGTQFDASNARSLAGQTWLLPKSRFNQPWFYYGFGSVTSDDTNWIVTPGNYTSARFYATER